MSDKDKDELIKKLEKTMMEDVMQSMEKSFI